MSAGTYSKRLKETDPLSSNTKSASRWLPHMTLIALAEIALLLFLAQQDMNLMIWVQHLRSTSGQSDVATLSRPDDPAVGTLLASALTPPLKSAMTRDGYTGSIILLFIGPCTSCSTKDLDAWAKVAQTHPSLRIILVSRDTQDNIERYRKSKGFPLPIVEDSQGKVAKAFNAAWLPRAYQVSASGTLFWLQSSDLILPEDIARELLARRGESKK